MRGVSTKTPERVAEAKRLRDEGWFLREIAEHFGVRIPTVHTWINDPDGSQLKARKQTYRGTCRDCGAPTDGSNGAADAPDRCLRCYREWLHECARQRIIDLIREWVDENGGIPPAATDWSPGLAEAKGQSEKAQLRRDANGRWPATNGVRQVFGSWNAAIEAAGFEPRARGCYGREGEDPAVVAETVRLYRSGLSIAQVAAVLGAGEKAIRYRLVKAGEPRRPAHRHKAAA